MTAAGERAARSRRRRRSRPRSPPSRELARALWAPATWRRRSPELRVVARPRPSSCPTRSSSRPRARCSTPRRPSASRAATPTRRRSRRRSSSRRSPGCGPRASARPTCATARAPPLSACRPSSSTRAGRSPATSTAWSASSPPPGSPVVSIGPGRALPAAEGLCEELAAIALIVPAQLIAERLAVLRGRDPDRPPGLTKVTRTH